MRPILFHLPGLGAPVYAYGTMLYLSLLAGWALTLGLAARARLPRRLARACFVITAVAALVCARLLFVATNLDLFQTPADIFTEHGGGLVAYGGFLGGFGGSLLCCRLAGLPFLVWADCAVPSLCTGLAITRIGCLLAGCDFGMPFDGLWALQFPAGSPAFLQQVAAGLLSPDAAASLPVHPTQVYESIAGLLLLAFVLRARGVALTSVAASAARPGELLGRFAAGYALLRFAIEMLRADTQRGWVGPLTTSQFIAIVTGAAGIALLIWLRRTPTHVPPPMSARARPSSSR